MPLVIKVAVSRKLTEDFNSRGWSLDIQSELDPRTLDDTNQLADSTNYLFQLANDLLDQQVANAGGHQDNGESSQPRRIAGNGSSRSSGAYGQSDTGRRNGNGHANSNGAKSTNGNGRKERPITAAQINAIQKMAMKLDTNGDAVALEDFNTPLTALTIKQASTVIDNLKRAIESPVGQEATQ